MRRITILSLALVALLALAAPLAAQTITMPSGSSFTGGPYTLGGTIQLGSGGTQLTNGIVKYSASLTPTAIGTACAASGNGVLCTQSQTFTFTGVQTTDTLFLGNSPAPTSGCPMVAWRPSSTNTLQIDFVVASNTCTPAAGTYTFFAVR